MKEIFSGNNQTLGKFNPPLKVKIKTEGKIVLLSSGKKSIWKSSISPEHENRKMKERERESKKNMYWK